MDFPKGINEKDLEFVGEGTQGKIYRIDQFRCLKIYTKPKFFPWELANLQRAKHNPVFPKVYQYGKNYMIREYIEGISLLKYLRKNPLTMSISHQLVGMVKTFKKLRFNRLDSRLNNIIITPKGRLKAIDPANAMRIKMPYPKNMLSQLEKLRLKNRFLRHVKEIDKKLYRDWRNR